MILRLAMVCVKIGVYRLRALCASLSPLSMYQESHEHAYANSASTQSEPYNLFASSSEDVICSTHVYVAINPEYHSMI